jgi:hypothetical protein
MAVACLKRAVAHVALGCAVAGYPSALARESATSTNAVREDTDQPVLTFRASWSPESS